MQGEITFLQTIFDRTLSPGFGEFTSLARERTMIMLRFSRSRE
jgi:hypothetical protein